MVQTQKNFLKNPSNKELKCKAEKLQAIGLNNYSKYESLQKEL